MSLQHALVHDPAHALETRPDDGIEDRRSQGGMGGFGMGGGGGGIPIPIPAGVGGGGALIILLIVIALQVFGGGGGTGGLGGLTGQSGAEPGSSVDLSNNGDMVEFMGAVLNSSNDLWADTFQRSDQQYSADDARAVHRRDPVGVWRRELADRAVLLPGRPEGLPRHGLLPGAQRPVRRAGRLRAGVRHRPRGRAPRPDSSPASRGRCAQLQQQDPSRQNELSVKMELQADCLAGVWAQSVYQAGDLEPGISRRASAPRLRWATTGSRRSAGVGVNPESWTHGSAEQRSQWFNTGFRSGDPAGCDTFGS